jgi:HJR/Mrr/RecB family endonuclease
MSIKQISREEFDAHQPLRNDFVQLILIEKTWWSNAAGTIIGSVCFDRSDKDWNYVILSDIAQHTLEEDGKFRWIHGEISFPEEVDATTAIKSVMKQYDETGKATEELFEADEWTSRPETAVLFSDVNEELKRYFAKYPDKLYELTSRKFEELIASILKDFGFDVELTKATRDGGRDIIAYIKNAVCSYMTYVECKKYSADNKVGVGIIREVAGVHHLRQPNKSIIVTTSFFTKDAVEEARKIEQQLELKDFDAIKMWLGRYDQR